MSNVMLGPLQGAPTWIKVNERKINQGWSYRTERDPAAATCIMFAAESSRTAQSTQEVFPSTVTHLLPTLDQYHPSTLSQGPALLLVYGSCELRYCFLESLARLPPPQRTPPRANA